MNGVEIMLKYYLRRIKWLWAHKDERNNRAKWRRMERQIEGRLA